MKQLFSYKMTVLCLLLSVFCYQACNELPAKTPTSSSGVQKATVAVKTDANGHTTEQKNIMERYKLDNEPGSIKHLYIVSNTTGECMFYSTVQGKVTSSGKRLTPITVSALDGQYVGGGHAGMKVDINGEGHYTSEVLQDDGTYGNSIEYLYWFDSKHIYHQYYPNAGTSLMVSDQPMAFKHIIMSLETVNNP